MSFAKPKTTSIIHVLVALTESSNPHENDDRECVVASHDVEILEELEKEYTLEDEGKVFSCHKFTTEKITLVDYKEHGPQGEIIDKLRTNLGVARQKLVEYKTELEKLRLVQEAMSKQYELMREQNEMWKARVNEVEKARFNQNRKESDE